jgi:hypothetical protein
MRNITEREIEWHPKTLRGISQIPQDGMEFAYVSEDYKQVHQLVWCKDFMQDTIYGSLNGVDFEVYGFKYDPDRNPAICKDKTRFMICNWRDHEFASKLLNNCAEFIHGIEKQLKMEKKTVFEKCINPPPIYRKSGVFIVEGSKRWMVAPPMISLYTILIRMGMVHPLGQDPMTTLQQILDKKLKPYNWKAPTKSKWGEYQEENDSDHLAEGWEGLQRILRLGDGRIFHKSIERNYPVEVGVSVIHDDCGLCGFSSGCTEEYFPHWHREGI